MDVSIQRKFTDIRMAQTDLRLAVREIDQRIAHLKADLELVEGREQKEAEEPPAPSAKPVPVLKVEKKPEPVEPPTMAVTLRKPRPKKAPPKEAEVPKEEDNGSVEMQFGRFWLVRAGVVMLLAGLVFLAEYARTNWWVNLPEIAKVASLYLGAFSLLGAGLWWERRREDTRQFGRVLAAGGAAAVYYTTYAAHYIESLQVIGSPVIAALLLLVWATVLVLDSERRGSQGMAIAGLLLAYFTCVLGEVTTFSYWSALILTAGGAALVMRRGWSTACFVGLLASYLSFGYWRLPSMMNGTADPAWFVSAYSFLLGYWLIFTFAALWPRSDFAEPARRTFVAINNGAFLALFSLGVVQHAPEMLGEFWLTAGLVLAGLSLVSRRVLSESRVPEIYLATGALVFTAGLFAQFEGVGLSLALALEAASLGVASRMLSNRDWLAVPAVGLGVIALMNAYLADAGVPLLLGESVLWMVAAMVMWLRGEKSRDEGEVSQDPPNAFALLAGAAFALAVWALAPGDWRSMAWLAGAAITYGVARMTGYRTLGIGAAWFALFAPFLGVADFVAGGESGGAWVFVVQSIAFVLLAKEFSKRQPSLEVVLSTVAVVVGFVALLASKPGEELLILTPALLAAVWYGVGHYLKLPKLAGVGLCQSAAGLLFALLSLGFTGDGLGATFVLTVEYLGLMALVYVRPIEDDEAKRNGALIPLGALAFLTFLVWSDFQFEHIGAMLVRIGVSVAMIAFAVSRRSQALAATAGALLAIGLGGWAIVFAEHYGDLTPWVLPLLIAVPIWAGRVLTRDGWCEKRGGAISSLCGGAAVAMVFALATKAGGGAISLPAAWAFAGAGVFGQGLLLGERIYRVLSLGLLGLATAHVLMIDVWRLGTLGRVASFTAVGIVLVVLGFFYNRFGERLRQAR